MTEVTTQRDLLQAASDNLRADLEEAEQEIRRLQQCKLERDSLHDQVSALEASVATLRAQIETVQKEKAAMAQAMVKATALVTAEKKAAVRKDLAQMQFAVGAQLFCRLREREHHVLCSFFTSWWTTTAISTLVDAVKGLNRKNAGLSPNIATEALVMVGLRPQKTLHKNAFQVPSNSSILAELDAEEDGDTHGIDNCVAKLKTLQEAARTPVS